MVSKQVVQELMRGDQDALRHVYDLYVDRLYKYAFNFLKNEAWAEETVQDAFLKLWDNRRLLDKDGNLWLYLYVICKRLCLSKLRETKRVKLLHDSFLLSVDIVQLEESENLHIRELEEYIDHIVNKLPPRQKQIFTLTREQGLTHKEIAQLLSISPNTVKNHMVEALKTLRSSISDKDYSFLSLTIFLFLFLS